MQDVTKYILRYALRFYRDNIEEVFTSRTASKNAAPAGKNPLDDLFSK